MLGLLALMGAALLGDVEDDDRYDDDFGMDEDLKPCTREWRSIHPYGYNQYTGGWNAEEDEENGW